MSGEQNKLAEIDEAATAALRLKNSGNGEEWQDIVILTDGNVMLRSAHKEAQKISQSAPRQDDDSNNWKVAKSRRGIGTFHPNHAVGSNVVGDEFIHAAEPEEKHLTKTQKKNLKRAERRKQARVKNSPNTQVISLGSSLERSIDTTDTVYSEQGQNENTDKVKLAPASSVSSLQNSTRQNELEKRESIVSTNSKFDEIVDSVVSPIPLGSGALATKEILSSGANNSVDEVARTLDVKSVEVDQIHKFNWEAWENDSDVEDSSKVEQNEWKAVSVTGRSNVENASDSTSNGGVDPAKSQRKNQKRAENRRRKQEQKRQLEETKRSLQQEEAKRASETLSVSAQMQLNLAVTNNTAKPTTPVTEPIPTIKPPPPTTNPLLPESGSFEWEPTRPQASTANEWSEVKPKIKTRLPGSVREEDKLFQDLEAERVRLREAPVTKSYKKNLQRAEKRRLLKSGMSSATSESSGTGSESAEQISKEKEVKETIAKASVKEPVKTISTVPEEEWKTQTRKTPQKAVIKPPTVQKIEKVFASPTGFEVLQDNEKLNRKQKRIEMYTESTAQPANDNIAEKVIAKQVVESPKQVVEKKVESPKQDGMPPILSEILAAARAQEQATGTSTVPSLPSTAKLIQNTEAVRLSQATVPQPSEVLSALRQAKVPVSKIGPVKSIAPVVSPKARTEVAPPPPSRPTKVPVSPKAAKKTSAPPGFSQPIVPPPGFKPGITAPPGFGANVDPSPAPKNDEDCGIHDPRDTRRDRGRGDTDWGRHPPDPTREWQRGRDPRQRRDLHRSGGRGHWVEPGRSDFVDNWRR